MQLQLKNLCKEYGTKCAVDHVNASLSPGVYGLLGANGAGGRCSYCRAELRGSVPVLFRRRRTGRRER